MDLNEDDVIQILKYMAESSFNELRLEIGDLKIVVIKSGSPDSGGSLETERAEDQVVERAAPQTSGGAAVESRGVDPVPPTASGGLQTQEGRQSLEAVDAGTVPIKAPMLGTFYRAPSPGEPPFVEVGTVVDEDTTVCIIEVMKLFTTIKAGSCGRITRVRAMDGQLVEYNQVLFLIEPPDAD